MTSLCGTLSNKDKLYFNCGYIVKEVKKGTYKIIGAKVANPYGEFINVSISNFNDLMEYRKDSLSSDKLNDFDILSENEYILKFSDLSNIKDILPFDISLAREYKKLNKDYRDTLVKVKLAKNSNDILMIEVKRNVYLPDNSLIYSDSIALFGIEDDLSESSQVIVRAFVENDGLVYRVSGLNLDELEDAEYREFAYYNGADGKGHVVWHNIFLSVPTFTESLFENIGNILRFNEYCLLYKSKLNNKNDSIILPKGCKYLVENKNSIGMNESSIVFNPEFERVLSNAVLDCKMVVGMMPNISEIYLSNTIEISRAIAILNSLLHGNSYVMSYLIDNLDIFGSLEDSLPILEENFNKLIQREVDLEGYIKIYLY